jgi:hypothetical protein
MTENHPITPPPELVQQWYESTRADQFWIKDHLESFASCAAQWGADKELEACCEWFVRDWTDVETADALCAARRPKPPSLKEQALDLLDKAEDPSWDINDFTVVRRALEQLDD